MSLTVTCPDCDKTLRVKDEFAGKKLRCPGCSTVISIPVKSDESDDDDFPGRADRSKQKRRPADDDFDDDDDDLPVPKARPKPKPVKKKSRRASGGTNWKLVGGLI